MDGTVAPGKYASYARGDHVHPTDTSRMAASATGADIAVSGSDATKIDAALAGKASKADVDPLLFAQYYPEGNVKSAAEFTTGIKYAAPDTTSRTIMVSPFCVTPWTGKDNSSLVGRVVIPPFVDAQFNPYISDDGTRYRVVGIAGLAYSADSQDALTAVVAPNTVTSIGACSFDHCTSLTSVSFTAVTSIGEDAFNYCTSLASVDFGDTPRSSVPSLGYNAFYGVPSTCKIIVPYTQYDAWKAATGWSSLPQEFVRHAEKADKPATFTTGNLAALDANGNPTDSGIAKTSVATMPQTGLDNNLVKIGSAGGLEDAGWTAGDLARYALTTKTISNNAVTLDDRAINAVAVSSSLASLTVNFPTATSGKVRDFGLRLSVASGITTAPEIVLPQGITFENADGTVPEIGADGAATILYFTETAAGVFLVKGEVVTAIS